MQASIRAIPTPQRRVPRVPALRVVMSVFGKTAGDSHMATCRVTLFADGTYQIEHGRPVPAPARDDAYAG